MITARGGSKRIPRKNIKEFCGKPIIEYSIESALKSGLFEEIMVSTDDTEIARISLKAGAKVPFFRSEKNSDDSATTANVIKEVLERYIESGKLYDIFCCIYPAAPFVTPEILVNAFCLLEENDGDSVVPVVQYSHPPQRAFRINQGRLIMKWPENQFSRSQDLEPYYHDVGQFYLMKVNKFFEHNSLFTKNTIPMILKNFEVQDIDTLEDWEMAETKYNILKRREISL